MADTKHHGHGHSTSDHPGVGTEDVNIVAISKFAIGLAILCIASAFLIWGVFAYLKHQTDSIQSTRRAAPGLNLDVRRKPPEPTLQESPILDLEEMRAAEQAILNGYSKSGDSIHIPIGQAMDIVAKQNLPARAQAPGQTPAQPPMQNEATHGAGNMRDGHQAGGPSTPPANEGKKQ